MDLSRQSRPQKMLSRKAETPPHPATHQPRHKQQRTESMRTKLIAANWKMYKTPAEACAFLKAFLPLVADHTRDEVVICPPFVDIPAVVEHAKDSRVMVGAQDMFWEKEGAYTGQVSAGMLVGAGCTHVIIGHSFFFQYSAAT